MTKAMVTVHEFDGEAVGQREDGYIDGTALCRANAKRMNDYLRLEATTAFLAELSTSAGPADLLVQSITTGPNEQRGTWVHPLVAYNLGQWCSAKAAVFVAKLLHAIQTGAVRVEVPTIPGPELRLRTLELAERVLSIGGVMEARDRMLLQDSTRNLLTDGSKASAIDQITLTTRCEERGFRVGPAEAQRIGRFAARLYRERHGRDPERHSQWVAGAVRLVATYTQADLDIVAAAIDAARVQ